MSILKETNSLKDYQVDIMGTRMVVDLEELMSCIKLEKEKKEGEDELSQDFAINAAKYEMLRLFLDVLLSTDEEIDEKMGYKSLDNLSFPFKLSFNTLVEYKIIKEVN
tara:strand:+ start:1034 stop:1357 length:324 start_codon:yes stop_codon:yes gene_type:complete